MYARLQYHLSGNCLYLKGKLDRYAICEAIRRHEPPGFFWQAKEDLAWPILKQATYSFIGAGEGNKRDPAFIVDISGVESFDSIGLSGLLHLLHTIEEIRGQTRLVGLGSELSRLLKLYNLGDIIAPYLLGEARPEPKPKRLEQKGAKR